MYLFEMMHHFKISVLIPCYNEEAGLMHVLGMMPDFVDEVVVIDNGSNDNSLQVARSYNVKSFVEKKRGYGSALLKGLQHVTGQIIAIIDGDGSYPVIMLEPLCYYMDRGNLDFVSGCRFPLSDRGAMPLINRVCNSVISILVRNLFAIAIVDSQSGMMVFKRDVLDKIEINNCGMGLSQEIKIKCWLNQSLKCGEYHISYFPRIGKVKFKKMRDGVKNLCDLLILWIKIRSRSNHT